MIMLSAHLAVLKLYLDALGIDLNAEERRHDRALNDRIQQWMYFAGRACPNAVGFPYGYYNNRLRSPSLAQDYALLLDELGMGHGIGDFHIRPDVARELSALRRRLAKPANVHLSEPDWLELLMNADHLQTRLQYDAEMISQIVGRRLPQTVPYVQRALGVLHSVFHRSAA